ncbi:Proteasome assembly chaperone 2, partial [Sesamum angolense]
MEFYLEDGKQLSPNCSTLVLPALSIGNVGQLAVDLLISSLKAEKIGYLDEPNVLPCVGNDAYSPSPLGKLALPVEAYESSSSAMTLVQQRSPVVKGTMIEYAKNVASFAAANGKNHVIILSSLDFGRWKNIDMSSGLQIYYLSSSNVDGTDADCETLGWNRLQDYDPAQRTWKYLNTLAEQGSVPDEDFSFEELEDEDYYQVCLLLHYFPAL